MKRHNILFLLLFTVTLIGSIFAQTVSQIILPQYIQGLNGTNDNRVPFVYRAKLDGLIPNATYRFINQVIISTNTPTTSGAGNCIFVNPDNSFVRTSNPGFSTAGNYGEFITDASGSFTGWFITEPTGNARFTPGDYVFMRIRLNDGAGGTIAVTYLTLPDSIKVIDFGTASSGTLGTAIYGNSLAAAKDFVFLYDDEVGTGRPIASTLVESDGVDLSTVTSYALFYRDSVDLKDGYWGTIIPNQLSNGIRRIERRLLSDGSLHPVIATDADGIWPSGANTVDPVGGNTTPIRIELTDAPLPVELISFSAIVDQNVIKLIWKTSSELNNRGFEVERKNGERNWIIIGFVNGRGTTSLLNEYSFIDNNLAEKIYSYRLKQVNIDGSYKYSSIVNVNLAQPNKYQLEQNYPNPFNPSTIISYQLSSNSLVTIKIYNALGNEIATLVNENQIAGSYSIAFSANQLQLASGTYFYELRAGDFVSVKKMLLMK
jgi:hypothetical protein